MFSVLWLLLSTFACVGAIGSFGSFPKPLTEQEEKEAIQRLMQGDAHARETLIVHNLRLVAHIAKKYQKSGDREDLISIGTIGLIKAVSTFSESKGALSAYAARCIENEILMSFRRERKLVETVSLEEPCGADQDGNALKLGDTLRSEEESIFETVQGRMDAKRLTDIMEKALSARERTVLTLRFGLNGNTEHTQKEVADLLGISQSYISRLEKRIIGKLKLELEKVL